MWNKSIQSGDAVVILQAVPQAHPELTKVPLAIEFAKNEEARQLIQTGIHDLNAIIRPYVLPPGTAKEHIELLRNAFMYTMKDPEFLADAKKSKLDIDPVNGAEVERTVNRLFQLSPSLAANLKEVLSAN
jgi:hypothetical protein